MIGEDEIKVIFISKQLSKEPKDGVAVYNASVIRELRKLGIVVHEIWPGKFLTNKWPFYNLLALMRASELFKSGKANIAHIGAADGILTSFLNVPIVHTIHAVLIDEILCTGELRDSLKTLRLDRALILKTLIEAERVSAERADVVVVPSMYAKQQTIKYYNIPSRKIEVIPHGVDIEEFERCKLDVSEMHIKYDMSSVKICFVGRLVKRKGVLYLIRASEILKNRNHRIKVLIVGDGPERSIIEKYIKQKNIKHVHLLGNLPHKMKLKVLFTSDIFCMPSLHEAFGIAVLEAMAAGKPIVASNVGGIPEIVIPGENGLLVPPRDTEALANALEKLIVDEELRYKMGLNAYKRALNFSWKKVAEKLASIYEKLV